MKSSGHVIVRAMKAVDRDVVREMIKALYENLRAPAEYMTDQKIDATFAQLDLQPRHLELDVFEVEGVVVGYALLFKFWYNEFGGMVLNIDELFVLSDFRDRGIASHYLSTLTTRKNDYVGLSLEVLPRNEKALALYKRNGFSEKETLTLYKLLE